MDRSQKCKVMRDKKEQIRLSMACSPDVIEAGRVVFSGPIFNGIHMVRILKVCDDRPTFDIELDGVFRAVRTERGLKASLVRKISARCGYGGKS